MPKHGAVKATNDHYETGSSKAVWIVVVSALIVFATLLLAVIVAGKEPLPFDQAILSVVVGLRGATLTKLASWLTMIAMPPTWIVVAVALSVYAKGPRPFFSFILCGAGGWTLNEVVKHLVMRPRPPEEVRLAVESSSSFPSGHSITAVVLYGFLIWLLLRYQMRSPWRTVCIALLTLCLIGVGLTRIYLGVHWTSDVLAGYALGLVWLMLYTKLIAPKLLQE